jgi:hypothetical protein
VWLCVSSPRAKPGRSHRDCRVVCVCMQSWSGRRACRSSSAATSRWAPRSSASRRPCRASDSAPSTTHTGVCPVPSPYAAFEACLPAWSRAGRRACLGVVWMKGDLTSRGMCAVCSAVCAGTARAARSVRRSRANAWTTPTCPRARSRTAHASRREDWWGVSRATRTVREIATSVPPVLTH